MMKKKRKEDSKICELSKEELLEEINKLRKENIKLSEDCVI